MMMEIKIRTRPSTLQKLLKHEDIGFVDFAMAGADNPTVRVLRALVPVPKEQIVDFNPFQGTLQFSGKASKKMLTFLEALHEHVPEDSLPPNYQQVLDALNEKYSH